MSKGKFAIGALFGVIVGGVAALLTAPKSGKETRDDLKKKADEVKKQTDKAVKDIKENADLKVQEVAKKADQVKSDIGVHAKDFQDRAEGAVRGAKEGFRNPSSK